MSPSGSPTVTQLPERRGPDEPPKDIASLIKSALPLDARVQALPLP
jgi:predicted trehalose synthase